MSPDQIAAITATAAGIVVVMGGAYATWRRVLPWWRKVSGKFDAIAETLVGRDAIKDAATGKELVPAQPGIGVRIATLEDGFAELVRQSRRQDVLEQQAVAMLAQIQVNTNAVAALHEEIVEIQHKLDDPPDSSDD